MTAYRVGWFGRIILRIEEERRLGYGFPVRWSDVERRWRDATTKDFVEGCGIHLRAAP